VNNEIVHSDFRSTAEYAMKLEIRRDRDHSVTVLVQKNIARWRRRRVESAVRRVTSSAERARSRENMRSIARNKANRIKIVYIRVP